MSNTVARTAAFLILACDGIAGGAWLFGAPNRSSAPIYRPLRSLLDGLPWDPARWWGGLLIALTIATAVLLTRHSEIAARRAFAVLFAFWAMFAFAYAWGAVVIPASGIAPIGIALICCIGHARPIVAREHLTARTK